MAIERESETFVFMDKRFGILGLPGPSHNPVRLYKRDVQSMDWRKINLWINPRQYSRKSHSVDKHQQITTYSAWSEPCKILESSIAIPNRTACNMSLIDGNIQSIHPGSPIFCGAIDCTI